MKFHHITRRVFSLPLVVLLLAGGSAAAKDTWIGVERIIAIGDVHGDYEQFVKLLRTAGLIDDNEDWAGGPTHLVQTGDVPDRGAATLKVMGLLMKLEKQARKAKGYVHALIGNHEAMNMYGDLRYVHPGEFSAFRNPKSVDTRQKYYNSTSVKWNEIRRPKAFLSLDLPIARGGRMPTRWAGSNTASASDLWGSTEDGYSGTMLSSRSTIRFSCMAALAASTPL